MTYEEREYDVVSHLINLYAKQQHHQQRYLLSPERGVEEVECRQIIRLPLGKPEVRIMLPRKPPPN